MASLIGPALPPPGVGCDAATDARSFAAIKEFLTDAVDATSRPAERNYRRAVPTQTPVLRVGKRAGR